MLLYTYLGVKIKPPRKLERMRRHWLIAGERAAWCSRSANKQSGDVFKTRTCNHEATGNYTLGHLSQRSEGVCSRENLPMYVHSSFIRNHPKAGKTQASFGSTGLNALWHTRPVEGTRSGIKGNTDHTRGPGGAPGRRAE